MKRSGNTICRFIALLAVSNALFGCSLTHTLKSADIPQLQVGSPLSSIQPATFAFREFRDIRNNKELIANYGIHKYRLDQPAAIVVAAAIRKELERNGHTCVMESSQSKSDFIVEGTVYKYFLTIDADFWSGYINGNVATKLTITSNHSDKKEFVRNYEGKYRIAGSDGPAGATADVSSQTLLEMVKEISRDPDLIEFIRNNTKETNFN